MQQGGGGAPWRFLHAADTWLHLTEVSRFLAGLRASGLLPAAASLMFAFVDTSTANVDLRAGVLLSDRAAWKLAGARGMETRGGLAAATVEALGIVVVHTPLMVPEVEALPRDLRGVVSEGVVSGVWSIGQLWDLDMIEDLEAMAYGRRFFAGMLLENFDDWTRTDTSHRESLGQCGLSDREMVQEARSWTRYLHDDDEHIKLVREFRAGRREFRTLHAMYRSEASEALPLQGISPDTILVARDCPHPVDE